MNAERLLEHYERIADAPDAIARLRSFVLNLAVRGKLVLQDPNDEPAAELLKRIEKEKARLVKAGEIKLSMGNATAKPEPPFELPPSWEWSVVEAVARVEMGQSPPSEHYNQDGIGIAFFQGKADFGERHPTPRYWCTQPTKLAEPSDILLSVRAPVGPTNVANERCCIGRGLAALRPFDGLNREFMLRALNAFEADLAAMGFGTTFVAINKKQLTRFPLPLPPLVEQHRIVGKVDELMALCDRLESARAEREGTRDKLTAASLARLNAPDPNTFRDDARFALSVLPALTTRADQIKHLRQTILSLAVRGKLAPQDAKEKSAHLPPLRQFAAASGMNDEVFQQFRGSIVLPSGWQIAPLAQLSDNIVDCPHTTPKWTDKGEICIRTNQLRPRALDLSEPRYVSPEAYVERIERLEPKADDILYSREGGILGIACRVPHGIRLCLGQRLMLIRAGAETRPDFLEVVLNSPFITDIAKARTTGGAAPRVNMSTVRAYPIPLPPLAEQHRIVAKVDELMALCDRLEASLAATAATRRRLLDALLAEALAPADAWEMEAAE